MATTTASDEIIIHSVGDVSPRRIDYGEPPESLFAMKNEVRHTFLACPNELLWHDAPARNSHHQESSGPGSGEAQLGADL